jgi:hypothetical protein
MNRRSFIAGAVLTIAVMLCAVPVLSQRRTTRFEIQEATIAQIQQAILTKQIATRGVVEAYLKRIQAYNGTCVNEPQGISVQSRRLPTRSRSTRCRR